MTLTETVRIVLCRDTERERGGERPEGMNEPPCNTGGVGHYNYCMELEPSVSGEEVLLLSAMYMTLTSTALRLLRITGPLHPFIFTTGYVRRRPLATGEWLTAAPQWTERHRWQRSHCPPPPSLCSCSCRSGAPLALPLAVGGGGGGGGGRRRGGGGGGRRRDDGGIHRRSSCSVAAATIPKGTAAMELRSSNTRQPLPPQYPPRIHRQ